MAHPRYRLRNDESGVSEVVGTILILAITVVLFATIILWVASIPAPPTTTKLDMDAAYVPILLNGNGANITLRHRGGEDLFPTDVRIYITVQRSGVSSTTVLTTRGVYTSGPLTGKAYGLVDGTNSIWNIGERWQWSNYSTLPTDTITAIVVDLGRNTVLWSGQVLGAPGSHPPIFLLKWADREWTTPTADIPYTGAPFHILARMSDADNDLVSVTGILTIFFGSPDSCKDPQTMYDDGTNGDIFAGDGVWTLYRTCMDSPNLNWDGSIVLFNATDAKGHYTNSRMTLRVQPNPGGPGGGGPGTSGRPPNLRYNGQQGYNIFNATEWSTKEFAAMPTRNFKENEQVVVVVGSLLLADTRGQNQFTLYDPFSGIPSKPVVYGTTKTVTVTSRPSNNQAFAFAREVNNYLIFVYKFDLNSASVGTNYYTNPAHPPYYFFAQYALGITVVDSTGVQFLAADAINVTDLQGNKRTFPLITTFRDSVFTQKGSSFRSTDTIYVQVSMFTVDATPANLLFGNIIIRDFLGGTQLFKAPINGRNANPPICPVSGPCTAGVQNIVTIVGGGTVAYRFSINLSRADQDAWVDGVQSYSLTIASLRDADEQYSNLAASIVVVAPLYRLDVVIATTDTTPPGTAETIYGWVYQNVNGVDRWLRDPLRSGLNRGPQIIEMIAVKYLDFDRDGDLDIASSTDNGMVSVHRFEIDSFGNPLFTPYRVSGVSTVDCVDIGTGDVTADGAPEIVCGGSDGKVWYYKNDGAWTRVDVDLTRTGAVNAVDLGDFNGDGANDIAVGRAGGRVTYYLNLDGQGKFANIAAIDDWFAETDLTSIGTIVANSYLATYVSDDVRESIREVTVNEPLTSGTTLNGGFTSGPTDWTYMDWELPASASGEHHAIGGNPGGYVDVHMAFASGGRVSGYWVQPFTVSGAGPWTATISLHYSVAQVGSLMSSVTLYAFLDRSAGAPVLGEEVWSTTLTGSGPWTAVSPPIGAGSRITGPGVYYIKVVARTLYNAGSGSLDTIVGFDNVGLTWSSTAGPVSELKHYWRIQQLPNRPSSTFTFFIEGQRTASAEVDLFTVSYAVGGSVTPPPDAAFVDVATIATTVDTVYSAPLPNSLGGQSVWIRVQDTGRFAGNTANDSVSVDRMYIHVVTSGGPTGSDVTMPDVQDVMAIDAGDQQPDGFADIVAATSGGRIYKLLGSSGGLLTPSGAYYSVGLLPAARITGIKWMNGTTASAGLEIALSYGSNASVITGSGSTGIAISASLASPGAQAVRALGSGDVDGDGDDDLMLVTGSGMVRYWRNLGQATSWEAIDIDNVEATTFDLDLGDMSKSAYVGR